MSTVGLLTFLFHCVSRIINFSMSLFRNQYDSDVSVWSPQGRIHQIEYAMEAVKQGAATVGLKSKTHAVVVAIKRAASELSVYQKKIYPIDDHVGISIAGLASDGRLLSKFMRVECLNAKFAYSTQLPISRLVASVGSKLHNPTMFYGGRPYGVGLLVAGYDDTGPYIYQTCPSANYYDCKAMAIGSRSQSGRTYLERHLGAFSEASLEELIVHGLRALNETLPSESELSNKNCSIGIVGKDQPFKILEDDDVAPYLDQMKKDIADQAAAQEEEAMVADEGEPQGGDGEPMA
ncbi:proteasome subunit alpha type-1-like [Oscarella lobularis]|uniref:proteasome subunit alpha type-1-like n=1 Tax=Oscarella lobularis TaxID=121494 RepID=UPI00331361FE